MANIDISVSAADLIDTLVSAGILTDEACEGARREWGAREITVTGHIDSSELVAEARTSDLLAEARSRWDFEDYRDDLDPVPFGEALTYARRGELKMAGIMAARAFGADVDLTPIERALQA